MNKHITILYLLASLMFVTSCQKELPDNIGSYIAGKGGQSQTTPDTPTSELKVSELGQFEAKGGEFTITVTASGTWTANKSTGSDWLTISPESGKAGTTNVVLKATENTAAEPRTATISLLSGDITKNVEVTQVGANQEISLDTSNMEFTSVGGSKTFKISTNTSWTVTSDQTWCSVSPESGKNDGTITVKVTENTSASERTAMITVKSDIGNQTVKVIQSGAAAVLALSVNSIDFTSGGGNKTFKISSNTSWTVLCDQAWCNINPISGSGDGSVTVQVEDNISASERIATITVKSDVGNKTVNVTQSGATAMLSLDMNNLAFESGSSSKSFKITSNTSWTVASDNSWCTVSKTSGSGDSSIMVYVSENTFANSRKATVTVESETITRSLDVTQSGAAPLPFQDRTFIVGGVQFKMIAVEGGTFTMGATSEQGSDAEDDEKPTHNVTLSNYSIGETEVTQALWEAVMGQKPTSDGYKWNSNLGLGSNCPAYYISWNDCQDFITKLNSMTGQNFRLPTEAEWEFAARGGNKSRGYKYAGSNTIGNVAWYSNGNPWKCQNVATLQANELGIYDMSGNVYEWCSDWYGNYSSSAQTNPKGPDSGSYRVRRGGSWGGNAKFCRVSSRGVSAPSRRDNGISTNGFGLRLAL